MKKILRFIAASFLMTLILLGCQKQETTLDLKEEIVEINIFRSTEFEKENSNLIVSASAIDHTEILETVKNIINDGIRQDGVVDTVEPNYYLEIIYSDKSTKELYLWLLDAERGKGSFMEVEDTHTIYNFSAELNAQLINLLDLVEN